MVVKKSKLLHVSMNGYNVGELVKKGSGSISFTYSKDWLNIEAARPISLSLPLAEKTYFGDVVYNFFDNLLPDNISIKYRIQSRFQIPTSHPFDILSAIGKDCVGALQFVQDKSSIFSKSIESHTLTNKKLASILRGYKENPLGMSDENDDFRISLAGAQEKAAFLYHNNKWHLPLRDTPTTHIFKMPIGILPVQNIDLSLSCENEWLCAKIVKEFGFDIADCSINEFDGFKVLVVKRFDRKLASDKNWIMRLPQEDMCQALGLSSHLKYQSDGGPGIKEVMQLLLKSKCSTTDRETFFRAQVLFWVLCAIDGHAKNFSVFIEPEGRFCLTPLYDVISAYPLIAKGDFSIKKVKMAMALKGKNNHYRWNDIKKRHFIATGKQVGLEEKTVINIIDDIISRIDNVIDKVELSLDPNFPQELASSIFTGIKSAKKRIC